MIFRVHEGYNKTKKLFIKGVLLRIARFEKLVSQFYNFRAKF